MSEKTKNKFEFVHNSLIEFCNKCSSAKKNHCDRYDKNCANYSIEYKDLYYIILYPCHPCGKCLMRPICTFGGDCDKYWHYYRVRHVADCEINDNAVFFSKEKIQMVSGHRDIITEEYIKSVEFFRNNVDFEITKNYIDEIKNEPYYPEVLLTVWQYLEYCWNHRDKKGGINFREDFF
jgi:hypothetical protein